GIGERSGAVVLLEGRQLALDHLANRRAIGLRHGSGIRLRPTDRGQQRQEDEQERANQSGHGRDLPLRRNLSEQCCSDRPLSHALRTSPEIGGGRRRQRTKRCTSGDWADWLVVAERLTRSGGRPMLVSERRTCSASRRAALVLRAT